MKKHNSEKATLATMKNILTAYEVFVLGNNQDMQVTKQWRRTEGQLWLRRAAVIRVLHWQDLLTNAKDNKMVSQRMAA